jgi:hypothetical protein
MNNSPPIFKAIGFIAAINLLSNITLCFAQETVSSEDIININSHFFRYINAYIVSTGLYNDALQTNDRIHFICSDNYSILPGEITVLQPIVFGKNSPHPISGMWQHHYQLTRCGKTIYYNTYVISDNGKQPIIISGLVGETKIPFASLIDTTVAAYTYVNYHYTPCPEGIIISEPFVYNTEVIHSKSSNANNWKELWKIGICNTTVNLLLSLHNGKKFNYQIQPAESLGTVE